MKQRYGNSSSHEADSDEGQTIVRDGSLFGRKREYDGREKEVIKVVERYKLDDEEQRFVERGVNLGVYEHSSNVLAVVAAVHAGAQTAIETRGQGFQSRKDAVEIAAAKAALPLVQVRVTDIYTSR